MFALIIGPDHNNNNNNNTIRHDWPRINGAFCLVGATQAKRQMFEFIFRLQRKRRRNDDLLY